MKYLIGDFSEMRDDDPINPPTLKGDVSKEDLVRTSKDEDYQVINLEEKTYFNPKENKWIKLPTV